MFKDEVFYGILAHAYGTDYKSIGNLMAKKDIFSPVEAGYFMGESKLQDSLAKHIAAIIPERNVHTEDPGAFKGRKAIMSTALAYYESRELDSIAKKRYRIRKQYERKLYQ